MHVQNSCPKFMLGEDACWVKMHVPSKEHRFGSRNLQPPKTSKNIETIDVFLMLVAKSMGKVQKHAQNMDFSPIPGANIEKTSILHPFCWFLVVGGWIRKLM